MVRTYLKPKERIKKKLVKRGSVIRLYRKYYKHGAPGSAITKDHQVVYSAGLQMSVYAMESADVEYLDKHFRTRILRCKTNDGEDMVVCPRIDSYQIVI